MSKKTNTGLTVDERLEIRVPILSGSFVDLTKFDFSFKEITVYDIQSKDFEEYIKNLNPNDRDREGNFSYVKDIRKQIRFDHEKKYAIVNNNPRMRHNYEEILNVWRLLLIIFPSDLQIKHIIYFQIVRNVIQVSGMSSWETRMTGDYSGELLYVSDESVQEVNEFAKLFFDRLNLNNYITIAINSYLTSFAASHMHYQYLTLCIALESIIHGSQDVSYRLKRAIAILCGIDAFNSKIIYENLNKIYTLRSKIIHGEKYNIESVEEYLKPLKSLVSRAIIELLIHNVPNNKDLDGIITSIGFGDRAKISDNWRSYQLNVSTIADSNWRELPKVK